MKFNPFGGRAPASPSTAPGERVYVIGDVHGCYDHLRVLLGKIQTHTVELPPCANTHIVFLGDLIDRGPDSKRVLRFVQEVQRRSDALVALIGNHEELMLEALSGKPGMMRAWLRSGGMATLASFGIEPPARDADPQAAAAAVRAGIPDEWIEWMRRMPLTARSGDYFFCHAGIRPGVPLRRQSRRDMLWIRDEFLYDDTEHGAVVVHGHTITDDVELKPNRIGVDTGAYKTGTLSALYLEGQQREIISVGPKDLAPPAEIASFEDHVPEPGPGA